MAVLTNPIFWMILILIILLMAIVGYLVESIGLDKEITPNEPQESPLPSQMPADPDITTQKPTPMPSPTEPIPIDKLFNNEDQ